MNIVKQQIIEQIEIIRSELLELSRDIHVQPEEYHAIAAIRAVLDKHGFEITDTYCGMELALKATVHGKGDGPHIVILADFDTVSRISHDGDHNVGAICAVGAAIGLSKLMADYCGRVSLIAAPAKKEGADNIAAMIEKGGFDDVDFALMPHPYSGKFLIGCAGRACSTIDVEFFGKNAHSSRPEHGINALSSVISLFNSIDLIRPTLDMYDNINGIITDGGLAGNIIPGHAACKFAIRANTMQELEHLTEVICDAVDAANKIHGTTSEMRVGPFYAERYPELTMREKCRENIEYGNDSIQFPVIHEHLWITSELKEDGVAECADTVYTKGALGLAVTAMDILSNQ